MTDSPLTLAVLRDIRDEIKCTRTELREELAGTREELNATRVGLSARLGAVESTLLELAEQQRFVVRYTKTLSERGLRTGTDVEQLGGRVDDLERRVDELES